MKTESAQINRAGHVRRAIYLEWFTVGYMTFEALAALFLGFSTRSTSLETFGLDSLIELASGLVLLWRLNAEWRGRDPEVVERVEQRAARLAGISLLLLALYIAFQSVYALVTRAAPEASLWGVALALVSLIIMPLLARAKLQAADRIASRALHADAIESVACAYLSFTLLLGLIANYVLGWWWADPFAALVMLYFIVREAREALAGEPDGDEKVRM
ncbi:MAG: cation transporter [Anaerolineae bacterium]